MESKRQETSGDLSNKIEFRRVLRQLGILSAGLLVVLTTILVAAEFAIEKVTITPENELLLDFQPGDEFYYTLYRGATLDKITLPVAMELGEGSDGRFIDPLDPDKKKGFYRIERQALTASGDIDGDQIDDVYELRRSGILDPLDGSDAGGDPDGNGLSHLEEYLLALGELTTLTTSPADGDTGIAVTRETIVRFSSPLADATTVTEADFYATFGGNILPGRIHMSPDRKKVTLFYTDPMPGNARIRVTLKTDRLPDFGGRLVDGDGDGLPGGDAVFEFDTLTLTSLASTSVCGRVFASSLETAQNGEGEVNCPIPNVKITVDGRENELFTFTDEMGNFRLEPAPVGRFFVHIDGRTSTAVIPDGAYYPNVGKAWESVAGTETNLGDVFLPIIPADTLRPASMEEETVLTFSDDFLGGNPQFIGVEVRVPPDSLFSNDGTRGGMIGIAPVDPGRLPGTLPPGLEIQDVVTIQTDGATNFDVPVPICLPNLPDRVTGERLPPGARTALWSFNHDSGRFEIVGTMTISADGLLACSDPGVGVLAPGWHGAAPGTTGGGGGDGGGNNCKKRCQPKTCPPCNDYTAGDPVHLSTGDLVLRETDLTIKGRGMDFTWQRQYSSSEGRLTSMGHGWDTNYNLQIVPKGRLVEFNYGQSQKDMLHENPDGEFERREFFMALKKNADETYTASFDDQEKWGFNPCDGSASEGKVTSIADRNGNTMRFEYDALGRLVRIIDTLERTITVSYNADGFIASVTDFIGRTVRYTYYQDGDEGGGFGDLKSVTTPPVVGTPNGNDFPNGKTRTYTYSKGFADEQLNHNLLTITDGRRNDPNDATFGNGPFVVNEYAATTDSGDINFDRVLRQYWGGDVLDFTYVDLDPEDPGSEAVTKTILNDRAGNVSEHWFDLGQRRLRHRVFTGRADPREPTTDTANRPGNKLRANDPDFFETRTEFTIDSLARRIVYPNGNITENFYEVDLMPFGDPKFRSNLRMVAKYPGSHLPAGDQEVLVEEFEYANDFGCNSCGFNFVTKHTDERGNVTMSDYDLRGNLIQRTHRIASIVENWEYNQWGQMTAHVLPDNGSGHRRRDESTYHTEGHQRGYRQSDIVDAENLALTTSYERDQVGRVIRLIDPRGNDRLTTYNALDQVVETRSEEVAPGSGVRYAQRSWYDANNNVIRRDVENRDGTGALVTANPWLTTSYAYEILDHVVGTIQEVTPDHDIVTEFGYDRNRNQTLVRFGEATNGNQPENTLTRVYDERNLLFREVRAAGHASQSTKQVDYDRNQNVTAQHTGIEATAHTTRYVYDGYDRQVQKTDPMGNVCTYRYDANSNRLSELCMGELEDVAGSQNNIRLAEKTWEYDPMNRLERDMREHFLAEDQSPVGDGQAVTVTVWSDNSQVLSSTNDNNYSTQFVYDTANRLSTTTDAKGNTVTNTYDGNHNRVALHEVDKSDLGNPDQAFTTAYAYDGLNRPVSVTDNIGNVNRMFYDSRSNQTVTVDARGNRIEYTYDGINRLLNTDRFMTDTGDEAGKVVDHIVTRQYWDDSLRLVGQEDDNGNRTTYDYDGLNRKVADVFADTTRWEFRYDVHDTEVGRTDANGSVVAAVYDLNKRVTRKDVVPGQGVSDDTTFEIYKYDGLSRLVWGEDDDSIVQRKHDSLNRVVADIQNAGTVTCVYDGVGNETQCRYPGGRVVNTTYDELERKKVISDAVTGMIAEYFFIGANRVERRDYGNGTRADYAYDGIGGVPNAKGDFGVKKMVRTLHTRVADGMVIEDLQYAWDQVGNKTGQESEDGNGGLRERDFSYDSAYRLVRSVHSDGIAPDETVRYTLDGVGNRVSVEGGGNPGAYVMNATVPDPADRPMNQYTVTPSGSSEHDQNGNRSGQGETVSSYDYQNRLVRFQASAAENAWHYRYDVFNRRTSKGNGVFEMSFVYDDWQLKEETSNGESRTHVHGLFIDELVEANQGLGNAFFHATDQQSIVAITGVDGNIDSCYEYSSFGNRTTIIEGVQGRQNSFGFHGRRLEAESNTYWFRNRFYCSITGRFVSRDPIGVWGDSRNMEIPIPSLQVTPVLLAILWVFFSMVPAA